MQYDRDKHLFAALVTVALHVLVLALASDHQFRFSGKPDLPRAEERIISLAVLPPPPEKNLHRPARQLLAPEPALAPIPSIQVPQDSPTSVTSRELASMAAPPAPSAEEWAFAAKYTLKNSKIAHFTHKRHGPNRVVRRNVVADLLEIDLHLV